MPRVHRKIHVRVELKEGSRPPGWRIARLALGTGDKIEAVDRYVERPRRRFPDAATALTEARALAWSAIHKHFGRVNEEDVIWEILPPDDCTTPHTS